MVIALLGAVLRVAVGVAGGAMMQHAMLVQPLTGVQVPYGTAAMTLAGAVLVAVVAAAVPARRATRAPYVRLEE